MYFPLSCTIVPPKPTHLQTPVTELCKPLGRSSPFISKMEEGGGGGGGGGGKGRVSDLISRFEENRYTCKGQPIGGQQAFLLGGSASWSFFLLLESYRWWAIRKCWRKRQADFEAVAFQSDWLASLNRNPVSPTHIIRGQNQSLFFLIHFFLVNCIQCKPLLLLPCVRDELSNNQFLKVFEATFTRERNKIFFYLRLEKKIESTPYQIK